MILRAGSHGLGHSGVLLWVVLLTSCICQPVAMGNPTSMFSLQRSEDVVEDSIQNSPPPWYDPETGKIRTLSEFQTTFELEEGNRSEARSSAALEFSTTWSKIWDAIVDFFEYLGSYLPDLSWLPELHWMWWVFAAIILILLTVLLVYFFRLDGIGRFGRVRSQATRRKRKATIQDLPFELESEVVSTGNLLQAAKAAQQKGDLRLAMIYLFSHLLLKMDERELILLRKGKTNRVYAKEIARADRQALPLYNSVMFAFEKCFFGHHSLQNEEVLNLVNETERWA